MNLQIYAPSVSYCQTSLLQLQPIYRPQILPCLRRNLGVRGPPNCLQKLTRRAYCPCTVKEVSVWPERVEDGSSQAPSCAGTGRKAALFCRARQKRGTQDKACDARCQDMMEGETDRETVSSRVDGR